MEQILDSGMRDRDREKKEKGKQAGDRAANSNTDGIKVRDTVLVRQQKNNKLTTTYEWHPYDVIDRRGVEVVVSNGNRTVRTHVSHTRPFLS